MYRLKMCGLVFHQVINFIVENCIVGYVCSKKMLVLLSMLMVGVGHSNLLWKIALWDTFNKTVGTVVYDGG